jgi:cytochrome c551/c552
VPEEPVPEKDPVVSKSYVLHYTIAGVVLILTLFWALWDEAYGQRPWKRFQEEFVQRYAAFLRTQRAQALQSQKDVASSEDYRKLDAAYTDGEKQAEPRLQQINDQLRSLSAQIAAVQSVFTDKRAYVNAVTYQIETSTSASTKAALAKELDRYRAQEFRVAFPDGSVRTMNFDQLEGTFNTLKDQRGDLNNQLAEMLKPINELKAQRDAYVSDHLASLTPAQFAGMEKKMADWDPQIVQINVAEANIVDRCESCHMGIREPLTITAQDMAVHGRKPDEYARAFTSHPEKDLLTLHDPDKFGCSPCHQGNGRATTSIEKAHGNYEHWLWPLFPQANAEAGCQTCHSRDMFLQVGDVGKVITLGKELYQQRGCMGCHRYEGYDKEPEELTAITQQISQLETKQKENLRQAALDMKAADQAESNEEANRLNTAAEALKVENSKIALQMQQLDRRSASLLRDEKKVGPDLKEIRAKLNRNWVPVWLHKPTDFRPTTKMPNFRLNDEQIKEISAYLWQSALPDKIDPGKRGDPARGKELFETRGCMACHSMGEGDQMQGGTFAANLTRVGEKDNYDYLVRWIKNPRQRLRPYCPYEKKDIGPEDYARHGLPYQFDLDHTQCPNDGHELQVQQMTVMPNLRLSDDEVDDIATYLSNQKEKDPSSYPDASFMEDPALKAKGKQWIRQFGCAGCHEIAGFETEGRIGTELTAEGSKPIERLDFALFTHDAEMGGKDPVTGKKVGPWYNLKGFVEHKLQQPDLFDRGMIKTDTEKLRMPDVHLTGEQRTALTTFIMGSQTSSLPDRYQYKPEDARHDIQEGGWIVAKYNCMGCHQFVPGQPTAIMGIKRYQDPDWKEQLPPKLLTEGARVDPEWLMRFLRNPALSDTDIHRNGVRPYLKIRMPAFSFSDDELRKLVRFFQALAQQPMPYIPQKLPPLTTAEMDMARSLFSSEAAPCLKCHATGDPAHDRTATAPNFLLAKDRLKAGWTERWLLDPQSISPGTSMPSGLFRKEGEHWVFSGPTPPSFQGYDKNQNELLTRYIFQLTPEEQKRVSARMPRAGGQK